MTIKYRIDLNKLIPANPVTVECGVAEGYFSEHILKNWKPQLHYAVDNWSHIAGITGDGNFDDEWHEANYKAAMARFKPFKDKVRVLRGITWRMSQHVPDNSVDLVYIDAGHDEDSVTKDIEAWWPKLKESGVMAFHDFENISYGVNVAVRKFAQKEGINLHRIDEDKQEDAGAYIIKPKRKK
jgi:hypothetical protein